MKEKVMDILMDLRPDVDFENGKKLIGDGILESFDIMSLVAELEDEFDAVSYTHLDVYKRQRYFLCPYGSVNGGWKIHTCLLYTSRCV